MIDALKRGADRIFTTERAGHLEMLVFSGDMPHHMLSETHPVWISCLRGYDDA